MNLQTNRRTIDKKYPARQFDQNDYIDKHITYQPELGPDKRIYAHTLNTHFRNLTEARDAIASSLIGGVPVKTPYTPVNALIDIKRGKYKEKK